MSDVWTTVWKELHEFRHLSRKQASQYVMGPVAAVAMAIFFTFVFAEAWWLAVGIVFWLSAVQGFLYLLMGAADLVAGERERHTLETLLATRLPAGRIAAGKIIFLWIVATGMSAVIYVMAIGIVVAIAGAWLWLVPTIVGGLISLAVLMALALFVGCLGFLASCRAETVQQAAQSTALILMVLVVAVLMLPMLLLVLLGPENVGQWVEDQPGLAIFVAAVSAGVVVILLNAGALTLALRAFRRDRLLERRRRRLGLFSRKKATGNPGASEGGQPER